MKNEADVNWLSRGLASSRWTRCAITFGLLSSLMAWPLPRCSAQDWLEVTRLVPNDAQQGDNFGISVSILGDLAVVGAEGEFSGADPGAAYLFESTPNGWNQLTKLVASDAAAGDLFGSSVSITVDRIIVGARKGNPFGASGPGVAYIFEPAKKSRWDEVAKFSASDATSDDWFGSSVDLVGDRAIVGARRKDNATGAAYIFELVDSSWTEVAKLTASDASESDTFGRSVGIFDDVAVVGAAAANVHGSAYIFDGSGDDWAEIAKLTPSSPPGEDESLGLDMLFGAAVAVRGDRAVVGAYGDDENGMDSGSAFIFERTDEGWIETAQLVPRDGSEGDYFGYSVALADDRVVVGSRRADTNMGSAYVFDLLDAGWTEVAKLTPTDPTMMGQMGVSVGVDGHHVIAGAWRDMEYGPNAGAAYVYSVPEPSSMVLAVLGLMILLATSARRRRPNRDSAV